MSVVYTTPVLPEMFGRGDSEKAAQEDLVAQCHERLQELEDMDARGIGCPYYAEFARRQMTKFLGSPSPEKRKT